MPTGSRTRAAFLGLLAGLIAARCSAPQGAEDGGAVDAGNPPVDSGTPWDSGSPADAGAPSDGGSPLDAGAPDAGSADGGNAGCIGRVPLSYGAPTDRLPHVASPPPLGDAGSVYADPDYGTPVLRLTDGPTLSYRVANEFWGNDWSTDSRLFYIQSSSGAFLLYDFDPATLTASRVMDKTKPGQPLTMPIYNGGFSRLHPTILYGLKGLTIAQFDFATQTETNLLDLTTLAACQITPCYALTVQEGANGLLISSFGANQQDAMPYVVTWDPATNVHHVVDVIHSTFDGAAIPAPDGGTLTIGGTGVHTIRIDLSGQYLTFSVAGGASWIWDTSTQTLTQSGGVGTMGWAAGVHHSKGTTDPYAWAVSTFAQPGASTDLISPLLTPLDAQARASLSWWNAVPGAMAPVIVETMRPPGDDAGWRAWDNELIAVRTDVAADGGAPTSQVWRFAHNFNEYDGGVYSDAFYYLYIPRVSQDGQFVIFDSNMNKSLGIDNQGNYRTDAFIAALPNACGP